MKRIIGTIKKRGSSPGTISSARNSAIPQGDSPEAIIAREVAAFCESGAPNSENAGDEFLHLPAIVDNAESSPAAAKEAASCIRRYLSKENYQRGFAQYNAIMLTRILTDNPARLFTQNFDKQFVSTTKELLRDGKDMSVQQILRETLDYLEAEKLKTNDTLTPLMEMWRKEKSKSARMYGNYANGPRTLRAPPFNQYQNNTHQGPRPKGLPPPDELAARIEEAKTTARLLLQTIQSTPSSELLSNELVKEFADRASSAHRSIQAYMNSENPHPDEDTMLTLIETNEQLNIAMSKHQRSVLQARKAMGVATPSPQPQPQQGQTTYFSSQSQPQQNPYSQPPSQTQPDRYSNARPPKTMFSQPPEPRQGMYDQRSPPAQNMHSQPSPQSPQDMYAAPAGPPRQDEDFRPPPGPPGARGAVPSQDYGYSSSPPPPGARGAVRSQNYGYSSSPPPPGAKGAVQSQEHAYSSSPPPIVPSRNRPMSENVSAEYGVAENPFSDEAAQLPPQTVAQKTHALFDSAPRKVPSPPVQPGYEQPGYQQSAHYSEMYAQDRERPSGPYASTPSYMNRQDSAINNVTMHGSSPPPDPTGRGSPVSPMVVDANAMQQRMGNLNV